MIAKTPLDTRDWAAARSPAGEEVSSASTNVILRPLIPPVAFTASKRAVAPKPLSAKVEEALPVSEVMRPIFTDVGVTPGALAVLVDAPAVVPPVVAPVEPAVVADEAAVVGGAELLFELEQAVATPTAIAPTASTRKLTRFI
jgi:hypothetical protein